MLQKKSESIKNQKFSDKLNGEKICVSATGNTLDSLIDPRFGRAMFFLIIDNQGNLIKSIENKGNQIARGAGVASAQLVANEKASIVISGNIGPNAFEVLNSSGIKIFLANSGMTIKNVLQEYKKGNLQRMDKTSVDRPGFSRGFGRGRISGL